MNAAINLGRARRNGDRRTVNEMLRELARDVGLDFDACIARGWSLAQFAIEASDRRTARNLRAMFTTKGVVTQ